MRAEEGAAAAGSLDAAAAAAVAVGVTARFVAASTCVLETGVSDCLCTTVLVVGIVEYSSSRLYMVFQQRIMVICSSEIISSGALVRMKESCSGCTSDSGDSPPPPPPLGAVVIPASRLLGRNFCAKLFGLFLIICCDLSTNEGLGVWRFLLEDDSVISLLCWTTSALSTEEEVTSNGFELVELPEELFLCPCKNCSWYSACAAAGLPPPPWWSEDEAAEAVSATAAAAMAAVVGFISLSSSLVSLAFWCMVTI